jgi:hypothetical protein
MLNFLKGGLTDAKGRLEIKVVLGMILIIFAPVYLIIWKDLDGAKFMGALGALLLGVTAVADGFIDNKSVPKDGKQIPPGE